MQENFHGKANKQHKNNLTIGVSADELVKNLEGGFAIDAHIEQSCETMEHIIDQLKNLYVEEQQTLVYYKMSVDKNTASASDIFDHTDDLQKQLDAADKGFHALHENLRNKINLFSQEDKETYTIKIQKPYDAFIHAIFDVQSICYEQKHLIKDIK